MKIIEWTLALCEMRWEREKLPNNPSVIVVGRGHSIPKWLSHSGSNVFSVSYAQNYLLPPPLKKYLFSIETPWIKETSLRYIHEGDDALVRQYCSCYHACKLCSIFIYKSKLYGWGTNRMWRVRILTPVWYPGRPRVRRPFAKTSVHFFGRRDTTEVSTNIEVKQLSKLFSNIQAHFKRVW